MRKIVLNTILLFTLSVNTFAAPIAVSSNDMTMLECAKKYSEDIDYDKCPIVCEGNFGDDDIVKYTIRSARYYKWYRLLTGGKNASEMRGFSYTVWLNPNVTFIYVMDENGKKFFSEDTNKLVSNSDEKIYANFTENYTGDLYIGISIQNNNNDNYKLEVFDLGDDDNESTGDNPNPTDVNEVNVSAQSIVGEKFHTILGQPLSEPQTSGVTVVTRTYSDGAVRSSKEVR